MPTKLNLGCGTVRFEDYVGVDLLKSQAVDILADLFVFPWPFQDNSVSAVLLSHFLEHVPHLVREWKGSDLRKVYSRHIEPLWYEEGFFRFFKEIHRILEPEGIVEIYTPLNRSESSDRDPTHHRALTEHTLSYLWHDAGTFDHKLGYKFTQVGEVEYLLWGEWQAKVDAGQAEEVMFALDHLWNVAHTFRIKLKKA